MIIRKLERRDREFLYDMCYEAVYVPEGQEKGSREKILSDKNILKYVEDFGDMKGDRGYIALDEDGKPFGAAWYRLFDIEHKGYGFINENIPELSTAVEEGQRGKGIGRKLLEILIEEAGKEGYPAISLSVDPDNPALKLYERLGFIKVGISGTSWTMKLDL